MFCFRSLAKVMNLDLLLIPNKLLQQRSQHRNLRRLLRIAKDPIAISHRTLFLRVHRNQKVNPKVNHPMINQVVPHHRITRRIKRKSLPRQHPPVRHRKNLRFSRQQYRRKHRLNQLVHLQRLLKLM